MQWHGAHAGDLLPMPPLHACFGDAPMTATTDRSVLGRIESLKKRELCATGRRHALYVWMDNARLPCDLLVSPYMQECVNTSVLFMIYFEDL